MSNVQNASQCARVHAAAALPETRQAWPGGRRTEQLLYAVAHKVKHLVARRAEVAADLRRHSMPPQRLCNAHFCSLTRKGRLPGTACSAINNHSAHTIP